MQNIRNAKTLCKFVKLEMEKKEFKAGIRRAAEPSV